MFILTYNYVLARKSTLESLPVTTEKETADCIEPLYAPLRFELLKGTVLYILRNLICLKLGTDKECLICCMPVNATCRVVRITICYTHVRVVESSSTTSYLKRTHSWGQLSTTCSRGRFVIYCPVTVHGSSRSISLA